MCILTTRERRMQKDFVNIKCALYMHCIYIYAIMGFNFEPIEVCIENTQAG